MIEMICLLCRNNQNTRELYQATFREADLNRKTYSARRLPDKVHYRIVKCHRCGSVFSDPILPPEKIAGLYSTSECNYSEQLTYITNTYTDLFEKVRQLLPLNPKVLEVGCGNGFFLQAL